MKFAALQTIAASAVLTLPSLAIAHPGHVESASHGHDHWLALAAVGAAVIVGLGVFLRRRAVARRG